MKQRSVFLSLSLFFFTAVHSQLKRVDIPGSEQRTLHSAIVNQDYELQILLPGGHVNSNKIYPVVYLLHPKSGALNKFYFLLVTLSTLLVWALFGGAITRMASVQVARNDKVGMVEALRFVLARYLSFFSAPIELTSRAS